MDGADLQHTGLRIAVPERRDVQRAEYLFVSCGMGRANVRNAQLPIVLSERWHLQRT